LAAEGLIALGLKGLVAILEALSSYRISVLLREGAHHVIKELAKRYPLNGIQEILVDLKNNSNYFKIPLNSRVLLNSLVRDNQDMTTSFLN
jgi:hypothetical protein